MLSKVTSGSGGEMRRLEQNTQDSLLQGGSCKDPCCASAFKAHIGALKLLLYKWKPQNIPCHINNTGKCYGIYTVS